MRRHTYIIGVISTLIITIGLILKTMRLPGASALIPIGISSFVLLFSVSYLIDRLRSQQRKALMVSTIILFVSLQTIMLSGMAEILHLPANNTLTYLSLVLLAVYFVFFSIQEEGRKLQLRKDRQLAAVLFTDIIGFTAMMGDDEEDALLVLEHNRKIQKKIISKHRGKWIKEMGDGSLVIFFTATEAVLAAVDIQEEIQNTAEFKVRMGIHLSEIVFTDTDVFGDGVNVASRISDKAGANEICISDSVYQNIRNRENLKIEDVGELELKNVAYKLRVHKIDTSVD